MGQQSKNPLGPDDIPSIILLRSELDGAFLAVARRYQLAGLSEDEARDYASTFILAALKRLTFETEPPREDASVAELWFYMKQQKPRVWWVLLSSFAAAMLGAFSLGALLG
ncbi:MAG: hypothetical protein KF708_07660 [Pirellulales bacterium]|nr:hypothetical protein [Pirellulales bacterium]